MTPDEKMDLEKMRADSMTRQGEVEESEDELYAATAPKFVRLLTMFSKAISDAVETGALPEDAIIDLSIITDDNGLQSLAGRIGMAAKSREFKRFLSQKTAAPAEEKMEEEDEGMSEEMGSEDMDKLMMERMS